MVGNLESFDEKRYKAKFIKFRFRLSGLKILWAIMHKKGDFPEKADFDTTIFGEISIFLSKLCYSVVIFPIR